METGYVCVASARESGYCVVCVGCDGRKNKDRVHMFEWAAVLGRCGVGGSGSLSQQHCMTRLLIGSQTKKIKHGNRTKTQRG